jgi:hypothetical protein
MEAGLTAGEARHHLSRYKEHGGFSIEAAVLVGSRSKTFESAGWATIKRIDLPNYLAWTSHRALGSLANRAAFSPDETGRKVRTTAHPTIDRRSPPYKYRREPRRYADNPERDRRPRPRDVPEQQESGVSCLISFFANADPNVTGPATRAFWRQTATQATQPSRIR